MPDEDTEVKTLEDLAPVIELYHHMVGAGNLDEAKKLYEDRLANPIYFQFSAYHLEIELLRALFLDGEDKTPRLKKEFDQVDTLNNFANDYANSGQSRHAVPLFEMVNRLLEKAGDKKNLAIGLGNVSTEQLVIGALSEAERNLRRRIGLCREIADEFNEAIGHYGLALVLIYRGEWDNAFDELDVCMKQAEIQKHIQIQHMVWAYRAQCNLLRMRDTVKSTTNDLEFAIKFAKNALASAEDWAKTKYPMKRDYVRAHWLLGAAYCANNELTLAEENLSKALNLCRQINMVDHEADILLDVARLRYAQGDFKDAQEKASEALVITERSGYVLQGADVHLFLAQYALEQEKDKAKAKAYAEEARKLATCDGPPYYYKVAYEEAERFLENLK